MDLDECCHDSKCGDMSQLTLRVPDELVDRVKVAASERGQSVNRWATAVFSAAVDPTFAGDDAQALRERLARAGLLITVVPGRRRRPNRTAVARARAAAGRGRPLGDLVSESRR
jgi:hypothetical protein